MSSESVQGLVPLFVFVALFAWGYRWMRRRGADSVAVGVPAIAGSPGVSLGGLFERLSWVVTALACCWGVFVLLDLAARVDLSAPQLAAKAAHVCAGVLVPYVFSRAVQAWRRCAP